MPKCSFCDRDKEDSEIVHHYLANEHFVEFILANHPRWKRDDGACAKCLVEFYREFDIQKPRLPPTDDATVITTAKGLIDESPKDDGAGLITIHGANLGKKYDLSKEEMILGRSETADIRVNEENVSRQHAVVKKAGKEILIEDLKSTNGTFVNTKKITSQALRDGDLVLVGNTILKFISGSNIENQYHEEIYKLATLDGLTQAYNKAFFLDKLQEEFGRSRRYNRDLSLIMFDFDHFHSLNNTYGHLAGDHVLKTVTHVILRNMRKEDVVGRYGGEEFAIVLPEISIENALILAEKIRKLVQDTKFEHNGAEIKATISIGVTTLTKDVHTVKEFIERADQALYKAKANGRNLVRS